MLKPGGALRSRMPALAGIITILTVLSIGTYIRGNLADAWRLLRVPSLKPLFADTRTITHSIDCLLAGQDPYTVRSCDPWHRLYNYPPIWLAARYLGVTSRTSNLIGTVQALLMASVCIFLFRAKTWPSAWITFFAVTSWSVLFAVERGNTDQLIFSLLIFGLFLIDRQRPPLRSPLLGLLIGVLTVLKVYPVVVSVLFVGRRNGVIKTLLAAGFSLTALLLTSGHRLLTLLSNTPEDSEISFGAYPFFLAMSRRIPLLSSATFLNHPHAASIGALIIAVLSIGAASIYGDRLDRFLPKLDFDHARGRLAVSGLAIFCFAFVLGASYDYRLIFLLGVLALLVDDMYAGTSRRSLYVAVLILLLMEGQLYLSFSHEIIDGLVFIISSAWLGTSLLHRIRSEHPPLLPLEMSQVEITKSGD